MKISITRLERQYRAHKALGKLLVVAFWLLLWQGVYMLVRQEILIVSPVRVFQRLLELACHADFWLTALATMGRILLGFLLAVAGGTALAACTSASRTAHGLFRPLISAVKATPVASFIILALLWIENGRVPVFTAFLMVLPVVWGNVGKGIRNTSPQLLEVAGLYRFGRGRTLLRVYAPSVAPYFTAACATGMGLAWKAGIAAEVLMGGTLRSIGGEIYNAKIYLETPDLFAWTAVVILMSVALEALMLRLMKKLGGAA